MTNTTARSAGQPATPDGAVWLTDASWYLRVPGWLTPAPNLMHDLIRELPWDPPRKIFGNLQPRLTAVCGIGMDPNKRYEQPLPYAPWTPRAAEVRDQVNAWAATALGGWHTNALVANHYRDANDSILAHADDESTLGLDPIVASVSLGGTRDLRFSPHGSRRHVATVPLAAGDLFVMGGACQRELFHGVDKAKHDVDPRVSLTFRWYDLSLLDED